MRLPNTTAITGAGVVKAGGGNATAPLTSFTPQQIEIKLGQSVMWYNPTLVGEPHTVSFVLDNKSNTNFAIPFAVPSSTKFMVLPPGSNGQPTVGAPPMNGMNTIVGINGRVYNPVSVDSSGNVKVMSQNANYTMTGSEKLRLTQVFYFQKAKDKSSWLFKHIYSHIPKSRNVQLLVHCPSLDE